MFKVDQSGGGFEAVSKVLANGLQVKARGFFRAFSSREMVFFARRGAKNAGNSARLVSAPVIPVQFPYLLLASCYFSQPATKLLLPLRAWKRGVLLHFIPWVVSSIFRRHPRCRVCSKTMGLKRRNLMILLMCM